jgi:hypothetical protein
MRKTCCGRSSGISKSALNDNLASGNALLARTLLAQGKTANAARLASEAVQVAKKQPARPPQFDAALALAAVHSGEAKFADATKSVQEVLSQAARYGYVGYQIEARLMLVQILAKSGKLSQAHTASAKLQKDAHAKGYGRIEREAAKFLSRREH